MYFLLVLFFGLFVDLYTKNLAFLKLKEKIDIFWDFFYLKYVENTWIAFSIKLNPYILKFITIFLIIFVFYYYYKEFKSDFRTERFFWWFKIEEKKRLFLDISFWLILAGAIWNWIERVFFWKVIDFIGVKYFFIFNLADFFISLGVLIFIFYLKGPLQNSTK